MAETLDVGTLSGRIELEDNTSVTLANLSAKIDLVSGKFDSLNGRVKDVKQSHEEMGGALDALSNRFERVGERVAEYFAIREATHFIDEIAQSALALDNLSKQTDINTDDLQVLGAATREYGLDSDQLGRAIFQLSQRIAGGDQSAATALHMMGLSLEQVKGLNGKDLFLTIESGLSTLQGTAKDVAAADLFGGRIGKSMVAFAGNADEALARAQALGSFMGQDAVKQLADYARNVELAKTNLMNLAGQALGPAAEGFNTLFNAAGKAGWGAVITASLKDFLSTSTLTGASTSHLATLLDQLNQQDEKTAAGTKKLAEGHAAAAEQLTAEGQAAKFMAALQVDAGKALEDWQLKDLQHLKDIGALNEKNAAAIGVNAAQFKDYEAHVKEVEAETKKFQEAMTAIDSVGKSWHDTLNGIDGETVSAIKYYLDAGVSQEKLAVAYGLTKEQVKAVDESRKAEIEGLKIEMKTAEDAAKAMADLYKARLDNQKTILDMQEKNDETYFQHLLDQGKITEAQYKEDVVNSRTDLARKEEQIYKEEADNEIDLLTKKQADEQAKLQAQYDQGKIDYENFQKAKANIDQEYGAKKEQIEQNYTTASKQRQQQLVDGFASLGSAGKQSFEIISEADAILNDDIDNTNKKVMTLDGTLEDAVKFKQQMEAGGSTDVTSANFADALKSFVTSGGWNPGAMGVQQYQDPYALAKKGYSFQEVIKYAYSPSSGPLPPPQGPRIPGFAMGGVGDFGDGTLTMLHGKEAIVPLNQPGALGNTVLNFNVNGTGVQVAQQIKAIILRELQTRRQFSNT